MQLRQLKSHLKKRGLKCDKCLQREWHAMSQELQLARQPPCRESPLSAAWLVARTPTHPPFTADTTRPCSPRNYVDELLDKCHLPVL